MSHTIVQEYQKKYAKTSLPTIKPGMTIKVTQKFKEGGKERTQVFQGVVIKMHEKTSLNATFTVRKIVGGVGVEKIFPIHLPTVEIEVLRGSHVSRAKLYYLRDKSGKSARLREKNRDFADLIIDVPTTPVMEEVAEEAPAPEVAEENKEETTEEKAA